MAVPRPRVLADMTTAMIRRHEFDWSGALLGATIVPESVAWASSPPGALFTRLAVEGAGTRTSLDIEIPIAGHPTLYELRCKFTDSSGRIHETEPALEVDVYDTLGLPGAVEFPAVIPGDAVTVEVPSILVLTLTLLTPTVSAVNGCFYVEFGRTNDNWDAVVYAHGDKTATFISTSQIELLEDGTPRLWFLPMGADSFVNVASVDVGGACGVIDTPYGYTRLPFVDTGLGDSVDIDTGTAVTAVIRDSEHLEPPLETCEPLNLCHVEGGAPTDLTRITVSCWLRVDAFTGTESHYFDGGLNPANHIYLRFKADKLDLTHEDGEGNITVQQRSSTQYSVATIYHVMCSIDTNLAVADDRVIFYIDGVRLTAIEARTNPALGQVMDWLQEAPLTTVIGARQDGANHFFDGDIALYYVIDGQALAPAQFASGGAPITYTGTYGNRGVFLDFEDNTHFGNDVSGNGNDFTDSGFGPEDQLSDNGFTWCHFDSPANLSQAFGGKRWRFLDPD